MFGKRYNNCVKKKATKEEVEIQEMGDNLSFDINKKQHNQAKTQTKVRKLIQKPGTQGERDAGKNVIKSKTELPKEGSNKFESYAPVSEGVAFLKREKEKKKSKSEYLTKRDAGKLAKRKMSKKDQ